MAAVANVQQENTALRCAELCDNLHPKHVTIELERFIHIAHLHGDMVGPTSGYGRILGSDGHDAFLGFKFGA